MRSPGVETRTGAVYLKLRPPEGGACASSVSGRCACLCRSARGAGAVGKMARVGLTSWVPCRRWGWMAVSFGFHRGLSTLLAPKAERAPRWLPGQCPKGWSRTRTFEHPGFRQFLCHAFLAPRSEMPLRGSQYPSSRHFRQFW